MQGCYVLAADAAAVNLLGSPPGPTFRLVPYDPPSPLTIVRAFFAAAVVVASLYLGTRFAVSGEVDGKMVALVLLLWGVYAGAAQLYHLVLVPLGDVLARLFGGAFSPGTGASPVQEETAILEHLLASGLPPEREVLVGARLAEIYRRYRGDERKADALLDRLLAKYPDDPALTAARRAREPVE